MIKISAIVATHAQPELTGDVVRMLLRQTRQPDEIIIENDTQSEYRSGGYAKNSGVLKSTGDIILICDHDLAILDDSVESMLQALTDWESAGMTNMIINLLRINVPPDKDSPDPEIALGHCRDAGLLPDEDIKENPLSTELCLAMMRRGIWLSLGGYDNSNFPAYGWCNQDFVFRAVARGYSVSCRVPRISTGKRLYSMDRWHAGRNHYDKESADREFVDRYGIEYTPSELHKMLEVHI